MFLSIYRKIRILCLLFLIQLIVILVKMKKREEMHILLENKGRFIRTIMNMIYYSI